MELNTTARTNQFMLDVIDEIVRARTKHKGNAHQLAALSEEHGELAQAMLQRDYEPDKKDDGDVYLEAVQTAAMAIRVATEGDSTFGYNPTNGAAIYAAKMKMREGAKE
ncbi:MAG: hypothetical protein H6981_07110 [Gammaproteobacteria bacterium]|nr:hypothetical protein [Gammaproteobacteria bacterium]